MPDVARQVIDRKEIGARIKKLRKDAGLRQWQLAEMIGATQPAIHMYERGVLPEPRRLLELARIGNTTVEWILTGRHWENGSDQIQRPSREAYHLAFRFEELSEQDRDTVHQALTVLDSAVETLRRKEPERIEGLSLDDLARRLREFDAGSREALVAALQLHESVSRAVMSSTASRLRRVENQQAPRGGPGDGQDAERPGAASRRYFSVRPTGLEPVRCHIFRLEPSMLVLNDIIKVKELRTELEETIARLQSRLEARRQKTSRPRKNRRART
jgi:transcriptional regulator with XRE-family HTH domain